jgi:site-specific DNA-methyltransferase (adenine-specific)/adenine-specific DNA-methyltransferase
MRNDYKPDRWHGFDAAGFRNGMDYDLFGNKPAKSRHWHWAEENARKAVSNYQVWENQFSTIESIGDYYRRKKVDGIELQFIRPKNKTAIPEYFIPQSETSLCNNLWNDISVLSYEHSYPTEKSEKLLYRIIEAVTDKNDLVMDFFAGSGTTAAVAEKLNRKWIVCDIGKLSFYTIQNRILNIKSSKSVEDSKKKYNKEAKSFLTINTGHYSLEKVFQLIRTEYQKFVMSLFEIDAITKTINGIKIDGQKKDGFYAMIWPYWEFPDSTVNETYLNELHNNIGKKVGNRLYIIAPASYVDYISDYCVIGDVKYFFLKVPYHIIKELHNVHFKKTRQPQSKKNVNALDDAIGFHFMMKPDVDSEISITDGMVSITINKFLSSYFEEDTDRILENYESLAIVLIDKKFNGNEFDLDKYYFAEDLLPKKKKKKENDDDDDQEEINIQEELKQVAKIIIPPFPLGECGKRICIIYIDIYGNEFKEEYQIDHSARR